MAFMGNLHLQLVWRKDWFSMTYKYTIQFSIFSVGFTCLPDVDHSLAYLLIPMGWIGWPGTVCMFSTCVYLIYVLVKAPTQGANNMDAGKERSKSSKNG
ncbi:hypothetical protein BC830DRAFT_1176004 [Chytriomyces sp. MP71]|nr:hypothetical protein BC830DRAFT_1176004 [Chytriomyces sp. MP71]